MRKALLVLGSLTMTVGCTARTSTAAGDAEIRQVVTDMTATVRTGDQAAIAALFAPNGVLVPPNEPVVVGRAAIQAWGEKTFSAVKIVHGDIQLDGVRVAGDWASGHGTWAMTIVAGRDTLSDTTRWIIEWERQADGKWLIARDIWNSGKPLPAPK